MSRPILIAMTLVMSLVWAQPSQARKPEADSTGYPGDHFDLQGALELFKSAKSPEEYEKLLNEKNNGINNLDLNEDGDVDYIRVVDRGDQSAHALVLQAVLGDDLFQDVAVLEIERTGDQEAVLQLLGDPDLYGEELIVEPYDEKEVPRGKGPSGEFATEQIVVNVWFWPCVRTMWAPGYVQWVSPWRWRNYPVWWSPWRPFAWRAWHVRARPFAPRHIHVVTTHRVVKAHRIYTPHRVHSPVVRQKTTIVKSRRGTTIRQTETKVRTGRDGNRRVTREKSTVRKPRGR